MSMYVKFTMFEYHHNSLDRCALQGRKKMLSDGEADLVGGPATYGGRGACFQIFMYMLEVSAETNIINRNHT